MEANNHQRILVLGGSGRTGKLVIDEALSRGYLVTALVRNSNSIPEQPNLDIIEGTPLKREDIERAVTTVTIKPIAVISTLGQTRKSGNPWSAATSPPKFMAESISNTISVCQAQGIEKLVIMSMFGARDSFQSLNWLMQKVMSWSNMVQTLEDQDLVDEEIRSSGMDFVLARAAMLKGEEALPVKVLNDQGNEAGFMPSISPKSVAKFLLDATNSTEWDGRSPVIMN